MKIKDIVTFVSRSITPQEGVTYNLYSLPSFDDGKTFEVLDGADIQSNKYDVPNKCILFNKLNVRFKRVWRIDSQDENKIASTEFLPLVVDEDVVDFHYCYYLLISDKITNYLCGQNTNTSGSHKRIDPKNFLNIEIKLPKMSIQRQIGKTLSALDRKIVLNKQINDNLEAMAKQLYNYWFVQFDFPNEEGKPYKSSGGAMVWNEKLKREIPKGWSCESLQNICSIKRGASPRPIDEYMDSSCNGMPWVKISDATVSSSPFLTQIKECIIQEGVSKSVRVIPNTLIVSNSATPGIPKFIQLEACVHDGWLVVTNYNEVFTYYLYYVIKMIRQNLLHMASGSIFKNLKTDYLKEFICIIPHMNILELYHKKVEKIMKQILNHQNNTEELTKLRDELLPLLMNGQAVVNSD